MYIICNMCTLFIVISVRNPFITEQWRLGVYNGLHIVFERAAYRRIRCFYIIFTFHIHI